LEASVQSSDASYVDVTGVHRVVSKGPQGAPLKPPRTRNRRCNFTLRKTLHHAEGGATYAATYYTADEFAIRSGKNWNDKAKVIGGYFSCWTNLG